jgi:hypothetical protein
MQFLLSVYRFSIPPSGSAWRRKPRLPHDACLCRHESRYESEFVTGQYEESYVRTARQAHGASHMAEHLHQALNPVFAEVCCRTSCLCHLPKMHSNDMHVMCR